MSALGQKATCAAQKGMSALPPKADITQQPAQSASGHRSARVNYSPVGAKPANNHQALL
jgi:hypothetical protein